MKTMIVVLMGLSLTACNLKAEKTYGPMDNGAQQQHYQIDFDLYPMCTGSCLERAQASK